MTFVCCHMDDAARAGTTAGFVRYPADEDDGLTDAWCEACETFLQANGGDWVEGMVQVPGGLAILCSDCYLDAKELAESGGRLHVLSLMFPRPPALRRPVRPAAAPPPIS
jgi:hypothetical protein